MLESVSVRRGMMLMGEGGLGRCDSCQEVCQSSVRCERYREVSFDGEL